jgi:chromosome segregation ATPase
MRGKIGLTAFMALFGPLAAHAQVIYICKDAAGKTFTSDRLLPECANRAVREMDRSGMVRREIPAPLTAEQKRHKQREEERLKAEAAAAEEQKQADRAMLARYRNESDIELVRKRTLELVQEQLKRESGTLAAVEKDKAEVQKKIDQANKKPPPAALQSRLAEAEQAIAAGKKKIAAYQAEAAQINQKFDAVLTRYRELTGGTAAASAPASIN